MLLNSDRQQSMRDFGNRIMHCLNSNINPIGLQANAYKLNTLI